MQGYQTLIKYGTNVLTKQNVSILISLILTINIYFGNFLKIPMKLDMYTKTQNYLEYRLTAENNLMPYVQKFNSLLKENQARNYG